MVEHYFINGRLHREGGPARIYYFDGGEKISLEYYYMNGKKHRVDGPAAISYLPDGSIEDIEYWVDGNKYEDIFKWMVKVGSL
jgi:antitoxin component YwqK of YwqJK toxin-antitoxin module